MRIRFINLWRLYDAWYDMGINFFNISWTFDIDFKAAKIVILNFMLSVIFKDKTSGL